ncbi:ubiquinol-cytochrome c reductase iron-sulfur subunit [Desulfosporosinus fructosivorans]|uniref:Ubiquinol-cytochrome c reductase iron-sulfur subunit n=1 Tax=Desulfosporosinus fructosivorans TaxID=2018669 RepID=A0A4Z0R7M3_9FIRM|nr:ubiquinol-cytochrome c reductase iron-sulfur subunit [Desulfosporosinus fructosivorans]TGE38840.1 ubiquinol-cytochrome c reductase iron-sulfur subunit [Desulfosporosinus fructosivorans]
MPKQLDWSRRAVLRLAWVGIIAASALTIEPLVKYLTSKEDRLRSPLVEYNLPLVVNSGWQNTANDRVWVKQDPLGVMALVATCTHLGCEVHYYPEKKEWLCPCHASTYDVDGRPVSGPAPRALPRVAVERKPDGTLVINTSKQVGMDTRL